MSRMRKPGWNACEELKKRNKMKVSPGNNIFGSDESTTTESVSSVSNPKPPRIKTLAQAGKSDVPKVKEDFKRMLPVFTTVEVRRHRIPYYDSIILELEEEGLRDAAEYLKMLFELDEEMRRKAGTGSVIWKKPRLKNQNSFLDKLRNALTAAENAKRSGNLLIQAKSLLDAALFFESKTWEWFWIAEQLYRSSLKIAANITNNDAQTLNEIRYLYGRFLFEKMKNPEEAADYLNEVRIASEGKIWNISKIIGIKQESLYRETCTLLHKALLNLTQQIRNENPELSVRTATHALERAKDSFHDEYIAAALRELGRSQVSIGNVKSALSTFSKFLAIAKRIPDPEAICDAHMELAFAYKELEDSEGTVKHLGLLRECASKYKLPFKLAQAHYYTGEYLLNKNQAILATPHLELALRQFDNLGKTSEANLARCAAGVSKGQEVMDRYVDLILKSGARDVEATLKICQWKNDRTPFWITETKDDFADDKTIDHLDDEKIRAQVSDPSVNSLITSSLETRSKSSVESETVSEFRDAEKSEKSLQEFRRTAESSISTIS